MAGKWASRGDNTFVKRFGPIEATISRHWDYKNPEPDYYYAFLSTGGEKLTVRISELGVEWHDDRVEKLACRMLEKKIKAHIRSWLK